MEGKTKKGLSDKGRNGPYCEGKNNMCKKKKPSSYV